MGRKKLKHQQGGWSREDPEFLAAVAAVQPSAAAMIGKQVHDALTAIGIPVRPADPPDYTQILHYTSPFNISQREGPTPEIIRNQIMDRVPRIDNGDYSIAKFTVVEPGTLLYRRQPSDDFSTEVRRRYFNYSGRTDPGEVEGTRISFLKSAQPPLTQDYYNGVVREFGSYLFTIRVKEPLLILHIPDTLPSFFEHRIQYAVDYVSGVLPFIDGYTLDFLQWNPNKIYKDLPSLRGFRELVVRNAANKMEVVSVIQDPVPAAAPAAAPVAAPVAALPPPRRVFITAEAKEANNSHGVFISKNQYPMYIRNSTIAQLRNGRIVRGELTPDDGYEIEETGELVPETNIVNLWSPMEGGRRRKITRTRKTGYRKPKKSVRGKTRAKKLSSR